MRFKLLKRCYACGHRLAYSATHCPQCGGEFASMPVQRRPYPDKCQCGRCAAVRASYRVRPMEESR
jgi:predicted amidophosphoribosyltransferase